MGTMVGYGCGWPFIPSGRMEEKGGGPWKFIPATTRDSTQPYLEEHPTWCSWPSVSGLAPEAAPEQGPSDGTVFTVALGKPCWALRTSWGEMWVKTAKTCYGTWVPFFFFFLCELSKHAHLGSCFSLCNYDMDWGVEGLREKQGLRFQGSVAFMPAPPWLVMVLLRCTEESSLVFCCFSWCVPAQ